MEINTLKTIKNQKRLTNKDIAKLSQIPIRTIEDIFRGKTKNPRNDTLRAIEKALEIKQEQNTNDIELNEEETELINLYRQLPNILKRSVIEFIKQTAQAVKESKV